MRILKSIYVRDHTSRIRRQKGALVVTTGDIKTRVPLAAIDSVTLFGGATMTFDAVASCVERGIRVAVLKRGGGVRWVATPPVGGNVHLRQAQHRSSDDDALRLAIARSIVGGKLQNSLRIVKRWSRDGLGNSSIRLDQCWMQLRQSLDGLAGAASDDSVRGYEGDGARAFFKAMGIALSDAELTFSSRSRRPPRTPVNALMSFAYSLLSTECTGALQAAGLDPQIGFLHRPRSGRVSLALDLMEELRPFTDRFVVRSVRRRQFKRSHFEVTPGGGVYLTKEGRDDFFRLWESHKDVEWEHDVVGRPVERWALPAVQATLLARHLRGDLPVYTPFVVPR